MAYRVCGLTILAALVSFPTAPTWGDDTLYQGYVAGPAPSVAARPLGSSQDWVSFPSLAVGGRVAESGRPPAGVPQAPRNRRLPFPSSDQRWRSAEARATSWETPLRLPDVGVGPRVPGGGSYIEAGPALALPVNDTWSEDDRHRIHPFRESSAGAAQNPFGRPGEGSWRENDRRGVEIRDRRERERVEAPPERGGAIYGRLLNKGRPVVNCHVVIVPLEKNGGSYVLDEARRPLKVTTDDRGEYYFENVPAGAYKLTWLPKGTNQWIRRIRWKPDAVVYGDEGVEVKDVRIALQTIN